MVSSIQSIVTNFGVNGIDIDLEPGSSSWTQSALREMCLSVKSIYGSEFVIAVTTGLYGAYTANWMNFLNALGHNNYDYTGPMLYDFPESMDSSTFIPVCRDKTNTMVNAGVPENKIVLGFMMQPAGQANYAASRTPQVVLDGYNAAKADHPGINGAYYWVDQIEVDRGWDFTRQVGPNL